MPQRINQKVVNTFIKGLITEAGEMTFPEGASVDELNCDLHRDGSRRRRLAVELEDSYVSSTFTTTTSSNISNTTWKNVGGRSGLEFLVVQSGSTLYFYNKLGLPYSSHEETTTVDLSAFEVTGGIGAANTVCQFASINGALVVASPAINTFVIERDNTLGTLSTTLINFTVRDFEWQGPKEEYTTGDATPSDERIYDTYNAGWTVATVNTYKTDSSGKWPPLTLPWFSGKNSDGVFKTSKWNQVDSGTSLIGNGRNKLDFFSKDRGDLGIELESSRFSAVESFSGRVFYAGLDSAKNAGVILYSPLIESLKDIGDCYQKADPTSEAFSDLLDTDGGLIRIPDAVGIRKLYSLSSNLFVFADNGVWTVNGVDGVFRSTEYSVKRISNIGIASTNSFVAADGLPLWWSSYGIHSVAFDKVSNEAQEQNVSLTTIQSFWDAIPIVCKDKVQATFDTLNKKIYWAYPNEADAGTNKLSNFLILDLALSAFYPWSVGDSTNGDYIVGMQTYTGYGSDYLALDVVTSSGLDVVEGTDDIVSIQQSDFVTGDPAVVLLVRLGTTGAITMGGFTGKNFLDWDNTNYVSYAEAGYDFMGDAVLKKTSPYIVTYLRSTEEGFNLDGSIVRPSSLYMQSFWDFSKNPSTSTQQAYRLKYVPVPDPDNITEWNYPDEVITTRIKVRGSGRSMRLRFESEEGKDFILIGYGVITGANQRY